MLGVEQRSDFRRASLVSEIYSETHGPTIGGGHQAAVTNSEQPSVSAGNNGKKEASQIKKPIVRPPPISQIPGIHRRKIPKGKFGLIGLGKH